MTKNFDLKKYLAEMSQKGTKAEFTEELLKPGGLADGLSEYLGEMQNAGTEILQKHLTEDEYSLLITSIESQAVAHIQAKMLEGDSIDNPMATFMKTFEILAFVIEHSKTVRRLLTVAIALAVGIAVQEEWATGGGLDINVPPL